MSDFIRFTNGITVTPLTVDFALAIGGTPQTTGQVGVPYSFQVSASGGQAPYTFDVASGTLPPGLALSNVDASTIEVSGTPTVAGTSTGIVLRVTDANTDQESLAAFQIDVSAALAAPTFTAQPTIGSGFIGDTLTISEGVAGPSATLSIEEFTLDGVDKTGELVGLDWDTTGEAAGEVRLRMRATNATDFVLSDLITFNLTDAPSTIPTTSATLIDQGNGDSLTLAAAREVFQWADGSWGALSSGGAVTLSGDTPAVVDDAYNSREMHGMMLREDIQIAADDIETDNGWDEQNSVTSEVLNNGYALPYDPALNKAPSKTGVDLQVASTDAYGSITKVVRKDPLPLDGSEVENTSSLERINVFTVVPTAPAVGSIRPPQFGGDQSLLNLSDADFSRVRSFTLPSGLPALSTALAYVQSPQLCNLYEGESRRGLCVGEDYARVIMRDYLAPAAFYMLHPSTSQVDRDALLAGLMVKASDGIAAFNAGVVQGGGAGQHIADNFCVALIAALCPSKTDFVTAADAMRSNIADQAFWVEAEGVGHPVDYQTRTTATIALQNHQPVLPEQVGWPNWHADSRSLEPWYTTGQNSSPGARYRTIALGMSMEAMTVLGLIDGGWELVMGPRATWNNTNDRYAQLYNLDVHRSMLYGALAPNDGNDPSDAALAVWDENRATFPEGGAPEPITAMPPIQANFDLISSGLLTGTGSGLNYDYAAPDEAGSEWSGSTTAITSREMRLSHDGIQFAAPFAIGFSGSVAFSGSRYVQERRSNALGTCAWSPNYPRLNGLDQSDRNIVTGAAIPAGAPVNVTAPAVFKYRYDEASGFPLYDEVTGTMGLGDTILLAGAGIWADGVDTFTYQWQSRVNAGAWSDISGETARQWTRDPSLLSTASSTVEISCLATADDGNANQTQVRSNAVTMPIPAVVSDDFSTDPGAIAVVDGSTPAGTATYLAVDEEIRVEPDAGSSFPHAYIPLTGLIIGVEYRFECVIPDAVGGQTLDGVLSDQPNSSGHGADNGTANRMQSGTMEITAVATASTTYFAVYVRSGSVASGVSYDITSLTATPTTVTPPAYDPASDDFSTDTTGNWTGGDAAITHEAANGGAMRVSPSASFGRAVSQEITVTPGTSYTLTYEMYNDYPSGGTNEQIQMIAGYSSSNPDNFEGPTHNASVNLASGNFTFTPTQSPVRIGARVRVHSAGGSFRVVSYSLTET